jgi:hypothetical protein
VQVGDQLEAVGAGMACGDGILDAVDGDLK